MSVSLYYQATHGQSLPGQSTVLMALDRAFGRSSDGDILLNRGDVDILQGMAATWTGDGDNPYRILIDALNNHGEIRVWANY